MNKDFRWKFVLIVATLLFFLFGIFGKPSSFSRQGLLDGLADHIHLGLDLKGGTHLILQVQVNDAVNVVAQNAVEVLKEQMHTRKIDYSDASQSDPQNNPDRIVLKGVQPSARGDLLDIVHERLPDYDITGGAQNTWMLAMKPASLNELKDKAVTQAIDTIRNRIDALGVSEPTIEPHGMGQYQILVQLPGVDDSGRVKDIMQSTAMLEIKQMTDGPYPSEQAARQAKGGVVPADSILLPGQCANGPEQTWCFVSRVSAVSGKDLRDAQASTDQNGQPSVTFSLTGDGGQRFYNFTSAHVGDNLAVVLDNKVQEVASIKDSIRDQGTISGGHMNEQQAKDLSMVLRSGALPASIKYLQEETVGPSLGTDSIRSGVRAAVIGMVAVLIFMLIYYRGAGINADVALIMNLIILLGFLGWSTIAGVNVALTLPGIAGVILTVGMGVDSNVLIFERIREEVRNGKTPPSAVDQGFSHAWITIVDTHVTTIVSAAILFIFGTGPVKGFATTLTFGLLANLFTAVFVSRFIFDWVLSRKQRGEALSI
ncbi:MAG TPA: protein translocase subunit SecD [Candidatus Acidoferrum sp.]|jgi:preprotein translocase subunit SecD|nr:protein translocase subunit SecD [Candidatus Acidoferrum sp.]